MQGGELSHFASQLFSGYEQTTYIEVRGMWAKYLSPRPKRQIQKFFTVTGHFLSWVADSRDLDLDLFFGVCPRFVRGGTKDCILESKVLWVDIDYKDQPEGENNYESVEKFILSSVDIPPPTFIIRTGNGAHVYWVLNRPTRDLRRIERINRSLAIRLRGDSTHDISRVLRVPTTRNRKREDEQPLCSVSYYGQTDHSIQSFPELEEVRKLQEDEEEFKQRISVNPGSLPDLSVLPSKWFRLIVQGIDGDICDYYGGDRSRLDFATVLYLLRREITHDQIASIFLEESLGISSKCLEKPPGARKQYIEKTIQKAERVLEREGPDLKNY